MPLPNAPGPGYDPWFGSVTQSHRLRAIYQILVNGLDVSPKIDPHLINIHIIDGFKGDYNCHIELDDRDGRLPIPPIGATLAVSLGWYNEPLFEVWNGTIYDVEHGFGRQQGGRRMWIHAMGRDDVRTQIKEPQNNSWGEGAEPGQQQGKMVPAMQMLQEAASNGGASIKIHPHFSNIKRDYWSQNRESFMQLAQRFANEHGGLFRIVGGNKGELTKHGEEVGGGYTNIYAVWGDNLLGWRVHPFVSRNSWAGSKQSYYDSFKSGWNDILKKFSGQGLSGIGQANYGHPGSAGTEDQAGQDNDGADDSAQNEAGEGRIVINGEPRARAMCHVHLKGARAGIDGEYYAIQVEHIYSRQGYVTWLDVLPVPGGVSTGAYSITSASGQVVSFEEYKRQILDEGILVGGGGTEGGVGSA